MAARHPSKSFGCNTIKLLKPFTNRNFSIPFPGWTNQFSLQVGLQRVKKQFSFTSSTAINNLFIANLADLFRTIFNHSCYL